MIATVKSEKAKEVGKVPLESNCYLKSHLGKHAVITVTLKGRFISSSFFSIIALKVCNHRPNWELLFHLNISKYVSEPYID